MPILRMETEIVLGIGAQLQQAASLLQQNTKQLNLSVQNLLNSWQGPSSSIFASEIQPLLQRLSQSANVGELLNQRLQREVNEWEQIAAALDIVGVQTMGEATIRGIGGTITPPRAGELSQSPYDVDEYEFRLNADELIVFRPNYAGEDLGDVMKELNAFISQNYANGMCADNPELIQRMADALGLDYQEAQYQYQQLVKVMGDSQQSGIDNLSLTFDLKGHWGSRRQLLFGKVVGDSMGLHPAFASLLSPSGGLIGPGDSIATLGLDGNLSGVVDENAWDYHGAAHDAAGYLYNNYGVGDGYEYINGTAWDIFNKDGLDTSNPVSGQVSGYLYWAQKLGISYKDFLDVVVKSSLPPGAAAIL